MIPLPVIHWVVWSQLDQYKSSELILLKGHLLIEVMMDEVLRECSSLTQSQIAKLSFFAKTKVLSNQKKDLSIAMEYAIQLNLLRNKLAHELLPKDLDILFSNWSEQVLSIFSVEKYQKYTRRTSKTQALANLARKIYGASL